MFQMSGGLDVRNHRSRSYEDVANDPQVIEVFRSPRWV